MTMNTIERLDEYSGLMTVADFREAVAHGAFNDYDGFGYACVIYRSVDGEPFEVLCDAHPDKHVYPSMLAAIPAEATHVLWFNK